MVHKKVNGTFQVMLTAHTCSQKDEEHYDSSLIDASITIEVTTCIILTLMLMANWKTQIINVKGTFLYG